MSAAEAQERGQAEYDRLVASAEAEVRLARQRALEEAAARMGELVVDVVERIIGREVDAAAHRDLIDEAVSALSDDERCGRCRGRRGRLPSVNPRLQGYAAAVLEAVHGDDAAAPGRRPVGRWTGPSAPTPALRSALTDTSVAPAARRAVLDDLLEQQGLCPRPTRRRLRRRRRAGPRGPRRPSAGWPTGPARRPRDRTRPKPLVGHLGCP